MGDEGWTEAVSDKTKRKQKLQQKQSEESIRIAEEYAKKNSLILPKGYQKKLQDVDPKHAIATVNELAEGSGKASQGKPKAKAKGPKWDSADELVDVIRGIVQSAPFVDVAGVGTKLQAITNYPWNKKFKPVYGTLGSFIKGYPKEFYVDENDRVYVRSEWAAAERRKQEERAQAKKSAAASGSNSAQKTSKKAPVTAKRRWCKRLCECLAVLWSLLFICVVVTYVTICVLALAKGDVHHYVVDWLIGKHYLTRSSPGVAQFLAAGEGAKVLADRAMALSHHLIMQFVKWYSQFRTTNAQWRALEEMALRGLYIAWEWIVRVWDATLGGTSAGAFVEHWRKVLQSSQVWQTVLQNFNRLFITR